MNLCYDALDVHVINGKADAPALVTGSRTWTFAELLGEVAAFAGLVRALDVSEGDPVEVDLPDGLEAVIALLAVARLGAVLGPADLKVRVVDGEVMVADLTWDEAMRAGRTDPAPVVPGAHPEDPAYAVLVPLLAGEPIRTG